MREERVYLGHITEFQDKNIILKVRQRISQNSLYRIISTAL